MDLAILLALRVLFLFFLFFSVVNIPGRGLLDLTITLARVYGNTQIVATPTKKKRSKVQTKIKVHTDRRHPSKKKNAAALLLP